MNSYGSTFDYQKAPSKSKKFFNSCKNFFSKPQNIILVILGIILSVLVFIPMISVLIDTFKIHEGAMGEDIGDNVANSLSFYNWIQAFTGRLAVKNFWVPLGNTLLLSVLSCVFAVLFGGIVAYLITRTNLRFKKYISSVFIFPYIMPQWTLAMVWKNLFDSVAVTGTKNGLFASIFGITMPQWWCAGLFPCALVLGLHYAPFAYILIGGIFRNMDANLEEAATILNTPKWKIFLRVTLPLVTPAILSTVLLVFSSAMGSYPVPHYLGHAAGGYEFPTLATKYQDLNVDRPGVASIISVVMMVIGVAILLVNQLSTTGRKQYTTVTGKSGQVSKVNLGKVGSVVIGIVLILLTSLTSIFPIISFAVETFLENPGDYSSLTLKWWINNDQGAENGMYGNLGVFYNAQLWQAFGGSILTAVGASILAGTIGTLVGYCVAKNRKSKFANYVNAVAFLPYLLPALSVGAAYFVFGTNIGLYNTYILLIIVGMIKYIPFASKASFNSMLQLSDQIEEAAIIQNVPWWKRMLFIIIPIQKTSILSGFLLPFITGMRELTLFMMLATDSKLATLQIGYFDEMGLYAFSSAINLMLIVFILAVNAIINKVTGASLDKGIGG
ncbi:MAG TPA: iron ABC transporter permease [Firmicutes bacterium]|nr:iron ABC transporter permease [Bacillota bacterium]